MVEASHSQPSDRLEGAAERILKGELPSAVRERWQPLRAGLMNIFLFEDERFPFADGRLLLRGTNGTGKSRVLAMTLPLLLDGSFKATRVEPDRDHNRQVAWNILMDEQDSATGYSWLEFGRLSDDTSENNGEVVRPEQFLTIGCGMRAKRGQRIKPWFFITERRVDDTLCLKSIDGLPLTQRQLAEELGDSGQVYDAANDYRRAVDEHLFRLGDRYDALIDLLLQLRQPKLAERLDIVGLESTLREALPPLQESLLDDAAEAFMELDQYRSSLEADRSALRHIQDFLKPYRDHVRRGVKRSLKHLTTSNSRYETAQRELRKLAEQKEHGNAKLDNLVSQQRQLKIDIQASRAAIDELQKSPEVQSAQRLDDLSKTAKRLAEQVTSHSKDLADAETELAETEKQHTVASEEAENQRRTTQRASDHCRDNAAPEALQNQHQEQVAACLTTDALDEIPQCKTNMVRRAARFAKSAEHLTKQNEELAVAERKLNEIRAAVQQYEHTWQATQDEVSAAHAGRDEAREANWAAIMQWNEHATPLKEYLPTLQVWAERYDEWSADSAETDPSLAVLDRAKSHAIAALIVQQEKLRHDVDQWQSQVETLNDESARLEAGEPIQPPVRAHRAAVAKLAKSFDDSRHEPKVLATSATTDNTGIPFWTLVDFHPEVPIAERGNWEAALHDAGLLDAVLMPDGQLVRAEDGSSEIQIVHNGMPSLDEPRQLARVLKPVAEVAFTLSLGESGSQARRGPSPAATASDPPASGRVETQNTLADASGYEAALVSILTVIGVGRDAGPTWVAADGSWRNGPLHGKLTKQHAQYIGEEARTHWRQLRQNEIADETRKLGREITAREVQIDAIESQKTDIETLVSAFPSSQPLISATAAAATAQKEANDAWARLETAQLSEADQVETSQTLTQKRDEDAADFGLSAWADRAVELRGRLEKYVTSLDTLEARVDALRTVLERQRSASKALSHAQQRAESCQKRLDQAKVDSGQAAEKVRVLRESFGQSVEVMLKRLESERQAQEKREDEAEELTKQISKQESDLAVTSNEIRHREDESRKFDEQRREATDWFASLHNNELLPLVFDEQEIPQQPWAMTTAIRLARQIDNVLVNVPTDEETWLASQTRLHKAQTELQQTVLLQDGMTVEVDPLRDGLQLVRFVLQGERLIPTAAASRLASDIATRERILDEKEQDTLEKYLLGEVAEGLRKGIAMAAELVEQMTREVSKRPMKTGMQMRFRWRQDDEGPPGLAEACEVLSTDAATWSPEEREQIKQFLQRAIRQQREEEEAGTWHEHMRSALDYRRWHRIFIERRKGPDANWIRLTRKTYAGGSGGEKAIALTLPPLAAAAAYYQTADPLAPRFILLDEAFAGISTDNRESCMELIVEFGLDAVLTSENEWGMYAGVPQLSICQLDRFSDINAVVNRVFIWNGKEKIPAKRRDEARTEPLFAED